VGHLQGIGADVVMEHVNRRSSKLHGGRDKIEEYLESYLKRLASRIV